MDSYGDCGFGSAESVGGVQGVGGSFGWANEDGGATNGSGAGSNDYITRTRDLPT